jgi:PAS domain-containing protein
MDQHPVIVADTRGVITQRNHAAETLFGYRADKAVGQNLDLVIPEHWPQAHWAGFHRAMKDPKVKALPANLPVRCADGEWETLPAACSYSATGRARPPARWAFSLVRAQPEFVPSDRDPTITGRHLSQFGVRTTIDERSPMVLADGATSGCPRRSLGTVLTSSGSARRHGRSCSSPSPRGGTAP